MLWDRTRLSKKRGTAEPFWLADLAALRVWIKRLDRAERGEPNLFARRSRWRAGIADDPSRNRLSLCSRLSAIRRPCLQESIVLDKLPPAELARDTLKVESSL